jgi:putative ABC transport system substrate-binding protein
MLRERADSFIVLPDPLTIARRQQIVDLAAKSRLPGMYPFGDFTDAGGLMYYGPRRTDLWRRGAYYVDRILKGARPADLPVEQPTKFECTINLRTSRALGLNLPPSILTLADEVIKLTDGARHVQSPAVPTTCERRTSRCSGPGARDARPPAAERGVGRRIK